MVLAIPLLVLSDSGFPFIVFNMQRFALSWADGFMAHKRVTSTFWRLSQRGLLYSSMPLAMDEAAWARHDGHYVEACKPTRDAMCEQQANGAAVMWFPTTKVDVPDDWSLLNQSFAVVKYALKGDACKSQDAGRVVNYDDTQYDVSLCDLMDLNLDIIFDLKDERLFWRSDKTPLAEYICLAAVSVYVVSCVCDNILRILTSPKEDVAQLPWPSFLQPARGWLRKHPVVSFESVLLVALIAYFAQFLLGNAHVIATNEDARLWWHLLFFMCTSFALESTLYKRIQQEFFACHISLLIASLLCVSARVYYTFDNPYTYVLSILMAWRSALKLHTFACGRLRGTLQSGRFVQWGAYVAWLCLDFFATSSLIGNGLLTNPSARQGVNNVMVLLVLAGIFGLLSYCKIGRN